MKKSTLCLFISVCFAFTTSEKIVPLCNFTQEYDSSAEVEIYSKGLEERQKQGLLVRVYFIPDNAEKRQGEVLFCPLTADEKELPEVCNPTNANVEFRGIENDTFNFKIKALSIADEGIYVLSLHTFNTTECRLKLSKTELSEASSTTTYNTVEVVSKASTNKSSSDYIEDAAEDSEEKTNTGLIIGVTLGVAFVIGICIAAFVKYRKRFRCFNTNTPEAVELGKSRIETPETTVRQHDSPTTQSRHHNTDTSVQDAAVDQQADASSLQGVSDTDEGQNDATDQQNLIGPMPDLERPHAQVQQVTSATSEEAAPLLSCSTTLDRSNGTSGAGQDKNQLETKYTDTCPDSQQDVAPSRDANCEVEESSQDEEFEQFPADELQEAREKAATETNSNEESTGVIASVWQSVFFGDSTSAPPDHDTGVT